MTIDDFIGRLAGTIINPLITLMFAAATVVFLWGIFQMIKGASDPGARDTGKKHITWGIIGLVVMSSVYAILEILMNTIFG